MRPVQGPDPMQALHMETQPHATQFHTPNVAHRVTLGCWAMTINTAGEWQLTLPQLPCLLTFLLKKSSSLWSYAPPAASNKAPVGKRSRLDDTSWPKAEHPCSKIFPLQGSHSKPVQVQKVILAAHEIYLWLLYKPLLTHIELLPLNLKTISSSERHLCWCFRLTLISTCSSISLVFIVVYSFSNLKENCH